MTHNALLTAGTFSDITSNILAEVAVAVIGFIAGLIFHGRRSIFAYLFFWRKFSRNTVIVVSGIQGQEYDPQIRRGPLAPLVPAGEAVALAQYLRLGKPWTERNKKPQILVCPKPDAWDTQKTNNILIIGGPKYNTIADEILAEIDNNLTFNFQRYLDINPDDLDKKKIVTRDRKTEYGTTPADGEKDHAMVILGRNPYDSTKLMALIAGLSHLSTLAAATWLFDAGPGFWIKARGAKLSQVIIGCRNIGDVNVADIEAKEKHFLGE